MTNIRIPLLLLLGLLLQGQVLADDTMIQKGDVVFQKWCLPCHGDGTNYPGTVALAAKYEGAIPPVLEHRSDLTPEVVRFFVRNGISIMPFFRKTEISDAELDTIAAYLGRDNK